MTLDRLKGLEKYWTKHPPVHILIANYLGYEAPEEVDEKNNNTAEENCAALYAALTSCGGSSAI